MFVMIARYDNEFLVNSDMKQLLTGADTLSEYRTLTKLLSDLTLTDGTLAGNVDFSGAVTAYNTANGTTYTAGDLTLIDSNITVSPTSLGNSGAGEIAEVSNIVPRINILNSAEVFDIGNIVSGELNGSEVAIARSRVGRLQAQFTDDNIRWIEANVSITQVSPTAVGIDAP